MFQKETITIKRNCFKNNWFNKQLVQKNNWFKKITNQLPMPQPHIRFVRFREMATAVVNNNNAFANNGNAFATKDNAFDK